MREGFAIALSSALLLLYVADTFFGQRSRGVTCGTDSTYGSTKSKNALAAGLLLTAADTTKGR